MTFEASMKRIDEIISSLEKDDLPLDESLELYKEGIALSADCKKALEEAKQQVKIIDDKQPEEE